MRSVWHHRFFILAFILLECAGLFFFYQITREKKNLYLNAKVYEFQKEYEAVINSYDLVSQTIFDEVINKEDVIALFQEAYRSDTKKQSQIREALFLKLKPTYDRLKEKNLKQLHFHLPDTTSFLRFHRPGKYGDNLKDIRFSLVEANTKKIKVQGFEEGRIYNGFRYVFPLFGGEEHIGSVETSVSFKAVREEMGKIFDAEYDFMIQKSLVDHKLFKSELNNYTVSDISPHYYFERNMMLSDLEESGIHACHIAHSRIKQLNLKLQQDPAIQDRLDTLEPFAVGIDLADFYYTIAFIPIENVEKQKVAYLISYQEDPTLSGLMKDFYTKAAIYTLFVLMLLAYIYEYRRVNRSLGAQLALEKREKAQSKQLLIQQSKLAGLGEMIGSIAHQWKQPLNALGSMVQDLPDAYEMGEVDKPYLENFSDMSMKQINFMSRTIEDFRNFFKPSTTLEAFDPLRSIQSVTDLLGALMKSHHIKVSVESGLDAPLRIKGKKNEFDQAVFNILNNAKDAIGSSGNLNGEIILSLWRNDSSLHMKICDNGGGVDEKLLPTLFDPYVTSKGEAGTGIGLYMTKTIITEHMGGSIVVNNSAEGVCFTITLPIVDEAGNQ